MTPAEAIEQLRGFLPIDPTLREPFKYEKATQLGIEALERMKLIREFQKSGNKSLAKVILALLPSETELCVQSVETPG